MPLVATADLFGADLGTGGIGAFNVITLEHATAIVAGAERAGRPVILQISENAVAYHGGLLGPIAAATAEIARAAQVPAALHLDHVLSPDLLRQAPGYGFGSVMVDFSSLPYQENVDATRRAAGFAHRHGLWIESELGTVGGKDGGPPLPPHAPGARTAPGEAAEFVAATGIDALAVAVGSRHAMRSASASLDHALISALHRAVPVPLVLHGSSGVPDDQLRAAVAAGMSKINIGTALNVAFTGALRQALADDRDVIDPRRYLDRAVAAVAAVTAHYLQVIAPTS